MSTPSRAAGLGLGLWQWIGIAVVTMAILSTVVGVVAAVQINQQTRRLDAVISCQTRYNLANADRAARLGASLDAERVRSQEFARAQSDLIKQFITSPPAIPGQPTAEEQRAGLEALTGYQAAIDAYLQASGAASAAREDNPLPTLDCRHPEEGPS